jgi:Trypsin-like peptidase domain
MRGRVRYRLVAFLFLLVDTNFAAADCVDPTQLAHTAVSITRHFDDAERVAHRGLTGVQGTGWFLSPTMIVTAEHVTAAMTLSTEGWKSIEISDGDGSRFIAARIQRLAGVEPERLAIIELQDAVAEARSVAIRSEPLVPEQRVLTIAYSAGRPHVVGGRFVRVGDEGKLAGMALLELYEGQNRLVVDHGASGAPVIDCEGRVAAVVSNVFTQSIQWAYREIRFTTAWGMPNVVSVPLYSLRNLPQGD